MDYEDVSRILNQLWWDEPESFILWFKENQSILLDYLGKTKDD